MVCLSLLFVCLSPDLVCLTDDVLPCDLLSGEDLSSPLPCRLLRPSGSCRSCSWRGSAGTSRSLLPLSLLLCLSLILSWDVCLSRDEPLSLLELWCPWALTGRTCRLDLVEGLSCFLVAKSARRVDITAALPLLFSSSSVWAISLSVVMSLSVSSVYALPITGAVCAADTLLTTAAGFTFSDEEAEWSLASFLTRLLSDDAGLLLFACDWLLTAVLVFSDDWQGLFFSTLRLCVLEERGVLRPWRELEDELGWFSAESIIFSHCSSTFLATYRSKGGSTQDTLHTCNGVAKSTPLVKWEAWSSKSWYKTHMLEKISSSFYMAAWNRAEWIHCCMSPVTNILLTIEKLQSNPKVLLKNTFQQLLPQSWMAINSSEQICTVHAGSHLNKGLSAASIRDYFYLMMY